jgi:Protein of unknown function (DUF2510)
VKPSAMRVVGNILAHLAGLASMVAAVAVAAVIMPGFGAVEVSITWFDTTLAILLLVLAAAMVLLGFVLFVVSLFLWRRKSSGKAFRVLGVVWAILEVAILGLGASLWLGYLNPAQAARPFTVTALIVTAVMLPIAILLIVVAGLTAARATKVLQTVDSLGGSGPATPPEWHPDPVGRHQYRYWDGASWTAKVSDNEQQSLDPIETPRPTDSSG